MNATCLFKMAKNVGRFNVQNVQMYVHNCTINGTSLSKSQSTLVLVRLLVYLNIQSFSPVVGVKFKLLICLYCLISS